MIILTLLCLLLPIISATPIPADRDPASLLNSNRDPAALWNGIRLQGGNCLHVYGENIFIPDCHNALHHMRHHLDSIPGNHEFVGPFSSGDSNPLFSMPMIWRSPTCSIGLDIKHPEIAVPANWPSRVRAAETIVQQCVVPRAIGGEWHSEEYFVTMIVNEQRMAPQLRETWDRCLRTAGHPVEGTRCGGLAELAQRIIRSGSVSSTTQSE